MGDRGARGYILLLLPLSAIWGASFMFIEAAVRDMAPPVAMDGRMAISALALIPVLLVRRGRRTATDLRAVAAPGLLLGVVNSALPFTLVAWGQTHVDSGVAAIATASSPIWVALLAIPFLPTERASGLKLVGIALGLVGIGILAGADPSTDTWAILGTLAVVLAAFCYAASNIWIQPRFPADRVVALITVSMATGALVLLPLALVQLPEQRPGWKAIGSVLVLAIAGTSIGLLIYYRMLELYGSARAILVTYLAPVAALAFGVGLLDEQLTAAKLIGLALILGGVALGSGLVRPERPTPAPAAPPA
jgi:drug/metabolite transporter (DMT)-like permease